MSTISEEAIEQYRRQVENELKTGSSHTFLNYNHQNAQVIVQEFIKQAEKDVYLFCGKLSQKVYGGEETRKIFAEALEKKVTIQIVIAASEPETRTIANLVATAGNGSWVRSLQGEELPKEIPPNHFFVVDGKSYRYEAYEEGVIPHPCRASVCANDQQRSALLQQRFEELAARAHNWA